MSDKDSTFRTYSNDGSWLDMSIFDHTRAEPMNVFLNLYKSTTRSPEGDTESAQIDREKHRQSQSCVKGLLYSQFHSDF